MILLQANEELRQTFERLIRTMKVPVKWSGIFAVVDNYIILQGEVRSLFFHFDTRKVTTNIIDIPVAWDAVKAVGENLRVQNAINMILYAFGKWGNIKGLKVEKSYEQLEKLFTDIMREIGVEPEYTQMYYRFYRNGMRITYEDVIQMALEEEEESQEEDGGKTKGLWRKMVWKREQAEFAREDVTVKERKGSRIGNNFYLVGYLCPVCGRKLHMVVYPMGKEFGIETEEGTVLLARAATCNQCLRFYTPRPRKLFADGDIYTLDFDEDTAAYDDYLELLGRDGERVSNYHTNEFADGRTPEDAEETEKELDELCEILPELPDIEVRKLAARMEEGYYSDENLEKYGPRVWEQSKSLKNTGTSERQNADSGDIEKTSGTKENRQPYASVRKEDGKIQAVAGERKKKPENTEEGVPQVEKMRKEEQQLMGVHKEEQQSDDARGMKQTGGMASDMAENKVIITPAEKQEVCEKYEARLKVIDRYSERQLKELKRQLEGEKKLTDEEKRPYLKKVKEKLAGEQVAQLKSRVDACEGKNYVLMKRILEEVEAADIPEEMKHPLREKLRLWKDARAAQEVEQLVAKMPPNLDRGQYRKYMERLQEYEGVDLSPYKEKLLGAREAAERQELTNLIKRTRKVSREDYKELLDRLKESDFLPELVAPYMQRIEEKIRQMDAEEIAAICPPLQMTFEEGMEAYEKIEQGDFLPELKADALKNLTKRLAKIKTDECELLIKKLQSELAEAGVAENVRHHFYPARKVLLNQAAPEETELIDFAMASYASGRGLFEYPILVVDATKNGTGKEGMILTPDHLYYSTTFSAYGMPVAAIRSIHASTGLLNRGLYVQQSNGNKIKIPYAVDTKELPEFAGVLDAFVKYLKEKPDSRKVTYLASEKHDTICCFRCGYAYKGGNVCPKCGYQNNG